MFATYNFNNSQYYAYIHNVKQEYNRDDKNKKSHQIRVAPETLTDDWLEEEISRAFVRDIKDPFYSENDNNMDALYDVTIVREGLNLIVLDENRHFFAKISIDRETNQDNFTVNTMYIYVSGDKRRKSDRSVKKIPSASIVWYFVALYAQKIFGPIARVLIPYPRDLVYKYVIEYKSMFVLI